MLTSALLHIVSSYHFHFQGAPVQNCISRDYGNEGTVCVCNSTYCDTMPRLERLPPPRFSVYTSNLEGLRFQRSIKIFQTLEYCKSNMIVDSTKGFQTVFGFGGAFTDSTGINIKSLPEKLQETLLRAYFSEDGIEYNMARIPIGSSDFSTHAYSYDDGPPDPLLGNFRLPPEDRLYKIPFIKMAKSMSNGKLQLIGSIWSAPKWMKTNNEFAGNGFLQKGMYQSYANYHLRFMEAFQKYGLEFWGITTGNQPCMVFLPVNPLEAIGWSPSSLGEWIRDNLGPTIRNSTHSNVKIMILDDQRALLPWYVDQALQDPQARQYIDGTSVHWYLDEYFPEELLSKTQRMFPEKFILSTEASHRNTPGLPPVFLGSWKRGEMYSLDIIKVMQNWVVGWMDWNMALDLQGGPNHLKNFVDSPIIINVTAKEFYKQPMYYHLGHFSKFVPRGSVRVHSEIEDERVEGIAFRRPDKGTVVVLLNRSGDSVPINIKDVSRGLAQVVLTPRSINTILYW